MVSGIPGKAEMIAEALRDEVFPVLDKDVSIQSDPTLKSRYDKMKNETENVLRVSGLPTTAQPGHSNPLSSLMPSKVLIDSVINYIKTGKVGGTILSFGTPPMSGFKKTKACLDNKNDDLLKGICRKEDFR